MITFVSESCPRERGPEYLPTRRPEIHYRRSYEEITPGAAETLEKQKVGRQNKTLGICEKAL